MDNVNLKRELEKILEAVELALVYHEKSNEANAALHASPKVLFSPLTSKLQTADSTLRNLIVALEFDE